MNSPADMTVRVQLANYLKLLRQQNHWTQDALARRIGISGHAVQFSEITPTKTTLTTLFKILQSLGVVITPRTPKAGRDGAQDPITPYGP